MKDEGRGKLQEGVSYLKMEQGKSYGVDGEKEEEEGKGEDEKVETKE